MRPLHAPPECADFPWLLSNVVDAVTGQPLADGKRSLVIEFQGWRVGLMGLIEIEWLDTLSTISPGDVR
jgi:5'-nucleotidase